MSGPACASKMLAKVRPYATSRRRPQTKCRNNCCVPVCAVSTGHGRDEKDTTGDGTLKPWRAMSRRALSCAATSAALLLLRPAEDAADANPVEDDLELVRERAISDIELVDEELLKREKIAKEEFEYRRSVAEAEAQASSVGKLCATPFGGITQLVALTGAVVSGVSARNRKRELEVMNEKLRQINMSLREQARGGMTYAPGLVYAPPQRPVETAEDDKSTEVPQGPICDLGEVRQLLKEGKQLIKQGNGAEAASLFKKALVLTKQQGDKVQERRAVRGLAAAKRLQGDLNGAIDYLKRVLSISEEMNEFTGDMDALGTIADIYTEKGDLEKAAEYYDKYLDLLTTATSE
eukprot:scaffold4129_cov390-Prasinococcus_capsulatus_cf.AAC.5